MLGETLGTQVQGAPPEPAFGAAPAEDFAATLLPRGLPIAAAARYSGIPARRLWAYIEAGRLQEIRLPGCRRVLLDRVDLDALLEAGKGAERAGASPAVRLTAGRERAWRARGGCPS